jgi:tetratricopeptide (TPR) repeat protein
MYTATNCEKDAMPAQATEAKAIRTQLDAWGRAMDQTLRAGDAAAVAPLAQVVLERYPRHLPTYARLLEAFWQLRRWEEGEEWARRLLNADPCYGRAWRAVARAAEARQDRAAAHAIWQRAFEVDPYQPDIRVGLSRTTLGDSKPLQISQAGLGTLYLRGYRWSHAATIYRALIAVDARRIDFQINLMTALWRTGDDASAYQLARHLTREHPLLLLPWVVLNDLGDDNDRVLAHNPIATMDPDGEFVRRRLRIDLAPPNERATDKRLATGPVPLAVSPAEAKFLSFTPVV